MVENAHALMVEIQYIMDMLGIRDYQRVVQILKTSVDPVPFMEGLAKLAQRPVADIIDVLKGDVFFRTIAADYIRRTTAVRNAAGAPVRLDLLVEPDGYTLSGVPADDENDSLSAYCAVMAGAVAEVPFVFRDDLDRYVGRFLGMPVSGKDEPDLLDTIDRISAFLATIDLRKVRYFISSGIGANEMYSHELALLLNRFFQKEEAPFRWIVANNPAHLKNIPEDATTDTTLVFEMSRSGSTKETFDFFAATSGRFRQRIVAANKGPLKEAAAALEQAGSARILILDDTRGDIGGRQMNRKTLMVYAPLFIALAVSTGDLLRARGLLALYGAALTSANDELAYSHGNKSVAVELAQTMVRCRETGRFKFSVIYDDDLRATAKELIQLLNEGGNKNIAGGTNDNILDGYAWRIDAPRYEKVFFAAGEKQLVFFLTGSSHKDHASMLAYSRALIERGIPCIVITVGFTGDCGRDLKVLARTSAVVQDSVIYFTYLTKQDANSNPAVKFVREITAVMFDIVRRKKEKGEVDVRISFADVTEAIRGKELSSRAHSRAEFDRKETARRELGDGYFSDCVLMIGAGAAALSLPEAAFVDIMAGSVSRSVFTADIGEAGGSRIDDIEEAFARSALAGLLGRLTIDRVPAPLDTQVIISESPRLRISVAVNSASSFTYSPAAEVPSIIAEYLACMYRDRSREFAYMTPTFMEADADNAVIRSLAESIVASLADLGVSSPLLALPGAAHTGIEAVMSHPASVFNVAIMSTNTYGGALGSLPIEKNLTVDDATYIYGIANVIRMALGGSPSVIFEVRDSGDLAGIETVMRAALERFRRLSLH
ncbi:MAG: hypothetical protein WCG78_02775 [Candidatus Omnitrophota bacterium]